MNVNEAIEKFLYYAEQEQVYNARTRTFGSTTPGVIAQVLHTVRRAARRAANTPDLSRIEFLGIAQMLAEHAKRDALETGSSNGTTEAARANRFVNTVLQTEPLRRKTTVYHFLPSWRPLAEALDELIRETGTRERRSRLHMLMELVSTRGGITDPMDLPSRAVINQWAMEDGLGPATIQKLFNAYNHARGALNDDASKLPRFDRDPLTRERGVRSLSNIDEIATGLGHDGPIHELEVMRIIELLAPLMHEELQRFIRHSRAVGESAAWEKGVVGAVSRVVASAYRSERLDLATLQAVDLFLESVELEGAATQMTTAEIQILKKHTTTGHITHRRRSIPLLLYLCEEMAALSFGNSPIRTPKALRQMVEAEEIPFFTSALRGDVIRLASLARFTVSALKTDHPEFLVRIREVQKVIQTTMEELNRKRNVDRAVLDKGKTLQLVTYPLVVCLGLPALATRVREHLDRYHLAIDRHGGDLSANPVTQAALTLDRILTDYVATGIFIADGLRTKNYTYARIGGDGVSGRMSDPDGCGEDPTMTHFWPEFDPQTGLLTRLRTHFSGSDHRLPRLKVQFEENQRNVRHRTWQIRPGIIDFELLTEFILGTRARNLARQGKIDDATSYRLADDIAHRNYAFFVSPSPSNHFYRRITGGYSEGFLSSRVKHSLYWMATEVLGHDLPVLESEEWNDRFPRALTGHTTRSLIASYLMGISKNVELACRYTNDTEDMLRKNYQVITPEQLEAEFNNQPGWLWPDFFDPYIKRIWTKGEVIDWECEDPLATIPLLERPRGLPRAA